MQTRLIRRTLQLTGDQLHVSPLATVRRDAGLQSRRTATAVALPAVMIKSFCSVGAIRSSVDRDFLRAHFQAHLLQRDKLPHASSSSISSLSSSSATDHTATFSRRKSPRSKVLLVAAIYEKTLKEPAQQQHPAGIVAFTDRKDLSSPT